MLRPHDWLLKRDTMFLEGEVELSTAHPYWYFSSWSSHGLTSKSLGNGKIQRKNQNNYLLVRSLCSTGNAATHSCTVLESTGLSVHQQQQQPSTEHLQGSHDLAWHHSSATTTQRHHQRPRALAISDTEHLSTHLLAACMSHLGKCLFRSCPFLSLISVLLLGCMSP